MGAKIPFGLLVALFVCVGARAGLGPFDEGVTVTDNADGSRTVEGPMVSVRSTEDDVQLIGCTVRGRPGQLRITCFAVDADGEGHGCFSFDPSLVDAADLMSPYSFVRFTFDPALPMCKEILVSTRSLHIPDSFVPATDRQDPR